MLLPVVTNQGLLHGYTLLIGHYITCTPVLVDLYSSSTVIPTSAVVAWIITYFLVVKFLRIIPLVARAHQLEKLIQFYLWR